MLCLTCRQRHTRGTRHDCDVCRPLLRDAMEVARDSVREQWRKPTQAESAAPMRVFEWNAFMVATAIRIEVAATDGNMLLQLPGVTALPDGALATVAEVLGCSVTRGTDGDTILVTGYEGGD